MPSHDYHGETARHTTQVPPPRGMLLNPRLGEQTRVRARATMRMRD